jgi:imidazolonepropionase-like amidohydrolase
MTVRIEAELLIPGRGDPIDRGTVVLEGDTIVFAGPSDSAPDTPDADATSVPVVMPGLWECHAHFAGLAEPNFEKFITEPLARLAARAVGDLHGTLMGGVTSAREMGGIGLDIQPAIAAGTGIRTDRVRRRQDSFHNRRPR